MTPIESDFKKSEMRGRLRAMKMNLNILKDLKKKYLKSFRDKIENQRDEIAKLRRELEEMDS